MTELTEVNRQSSKAVNNIRRKLNFETDDNKPDNQTHKNDGNGVSESVVSVNQLEVQVKRTFSGAGNDTWTDFFANISKLHCWSTDRKKTCIFHNT